MKLFLLSKENVHLAKAEVEALVGKGTLFENVLLVETSKKTDRLAYTRFILNLIFEAKNNEIEQKLKKTNWNKIVKGTFALNFLVDSEKSQTLSRKYGGLIYDLLKTPKVDLENPKTNIFAVQVKNKTYFLVKPTTFMNLSGKAVNYYLF